MTVRKGPRTIHVSLSPEIDTTTIQPEMQNPNSTTHEYRFRVRYQYPYQGGTIFALAYYVDCIISDFPLDEILGTYTDDESADNF